MVYDCFPFFNELDILSLRLNILDGLVDRFVISESPLTFSGQPKPLYYQENKDLFKAFHHKIIHNIVPPGDLTINSFERDVYQKDGVKDGLINCNDNDIIIFSDLDEIPNPKKLEEIFKDFDPLKVYHMAQRNFYFYVNMEEISGSLLSYTGEFDNVDEKKKWLGTKVCSFKLVRDIPISHLRWPVMKENGIRVKEGGWHFTYMGGDKTEDIDKRIELKIKSSSHQELNKKGILRNIKKRVTSGKDLFGRRTDFKVVEIDDSYPDFLRAHLDEYTHLIKKKDDRNRVFPWSRFW